MIKKLIFGAAALALLAAPPAAADDPSQGAKPAIDGLSARLDGNRATARRRVRNDVLQFEPPVRMYHVAQGEIAHLRLGIVERLEPRPIYILKPRVRQHALNQIMRIVAEIAEETIRLIHMANVITSNRGYKALRGRIREAPLRVGIGVHHRAHADARKIIGTCCGQTGHT